MAYLGKSSPLTWFVYVISISTLVFFFVRLEKRSNEQNVELQKRAVYIQARIGRYYAAGAVYTRWGRKRCPRFSRLIYEGVMAGQHFKHYGGGSNFLCLPRNPTWAKVLSGSQLDGFIHGTEYEIPPYLFESIGPFFFNRYTKLLHNQDAPCAVCQTINPATVTMFPARPYCFPGWRLEYTGYLMSAHPQHNGRMDYVCVDKYPETNTAGYRDENGTLIYNVESKCGSLPCKPYWNHWEIACSVCSKYPNFHGYFLKKKKMIPLKSKQ